MDSLRGVGKLLRHLHLKVLREGLVVGLILGRQLGQEFLISNSHVSVKPLGSVQSVSCAPWGKEREVEEETKGGKASQTQGDSTVNGVRLCSVAMAFSGSK